MKSREEQEFEVGFDDGALKDWLDETEMPDETQAVNEEEPSNGTLNLLLKLNMILYGQRLRYTTPYVRLFALYYT